MPYSPRILVVDDEPKVLRFLRQLLEREGYVVDTCETPDDAVAKARAVSHDLLIVDITLPPPSGVSPDERAGANALALVRLIRQAQPRLPCLILAAHATLRKAAGILDDDVQGYITKPLDLSEVRETLLRTAGPARITDKLQAPPEEEPKREMPPEQFRPAAVEAAEASLADEVTRRLSGVLALPEFLNLLVAVVSEKLAARRCSVMLRDGDWLVVRAAVGPRAELLIGERQRMGKGISGWVAEQAEPLCIPDMRNPNPLPPLGAEHSTAEVLKQFQESKDRRYATHSCLIAPLLAQNETVMAVINLADKLDDTPFNEKDLAMLCTMAPSLSAALQNSLCYHELQTACVSTLRSFASALEARDRFMCGHSQRVADRALAVALALGLSRREVEVLEVAALLHDIGRVSIPEHVLSKSEPLTEAEYQLVRGHAVAGERLLAALDFLAEARTVIRHHHERFDGTGYPDGLRGADIPVLSRILAIADAFDAMTSERPYRPARSVEEAVSELKANAATQDKPGQFDGELVRIFCATIHEGQI